MPSPMMCADGEIEVDGTQEADVQKAHVHKSRSMLGYHRHTAHRHADQDSGLFGSHSSDVVTT